METNKTELTIEEVRSDYRLPLYSECGGQESRAYLALDTRDGEVYTFERLAHESGVTQAQAHGHVRTYRIPNNLTVEGLRKLLADKTLRELLRRIYHGAQEDYDNGNFYTTLRDDAALAEEEAQEFCDRIEPGDYGALEPWCAADYLHLCNYRDLVSEGEGHGEAAARLVQEADDLGKYLMARDVELRLDEMKERLMGNE